MPNQYGFNVPPRPEGATAALVLADGTVFWAPARHPAGVPYPLDST